MAHKNDKHSIKNFFAAEVSRAQKDESSGKLGSTFCYVFGYTEKKGRYPCHYLKIGQTKHLVKRFQSVAPYNPKLKYFYSSPYLKEEILHVLFEEKRFMGEWFRFSKKSESLLKNMFDNNDYRVQYDSVWKKFHSLDGLLGGKKFLRELRKTIKEFNNLTYIKQNGGEGERAVKRLKLMVNSKLKEMQGSLTSRYPYSAEVPSS